VIPEAGTSIACFVAYQQSGAYSKTPERYGTGHPEGLIALEPAKSGVAFGKLVPLLIGVILDLLRSSKPDPFGYKASETGSSL